jgi:sulfonate transport system substrate-binding protein
MERIAHNMESIERENPQNTPKDTASVGTRFIRLFGRGSRGGIRPRLWWAFAVLVCVALVGFLVAGKIRGGPAPQVVEIGTFSDAIDYAPFYVAKSKGWFDDSLRPLHEIVHYTTFQSLAPINESFATNRVDVVFEAETPAIIGRAAGIDLKIAGISCTLTQDIVVRDGSGISSLQELRGKKVAVLSGTSSQYNLLKILQNEGVPQAGVQIYDMSPPDAKNAFETWQIDAWAVWPPWLQQEVVDKKGTILPGGNTKIQSIVAIQDRFAEQSSSSLAAILDVVNRAKEWIRDNPDEAQRIVANQLGIPQQVVTLAWPEHDWNATLDPQVIQDIQAKADFLLSTGLVKQSVDVQHQLIYAQP